MCFEHIVEPPMSEEAKKENAAQEEYVNSLKKLARSGVKELIKTKPKKGEYVLGYDSKAAVVAQLCVAYNLLTLNDSVDKLEEDITKMLSSNIWG